MTIAESKIQMQQRSQKRRSRLLEEFVEKHPDCEEAHFDAYLEGYARGVQESEMDAEGADVGFYEEDFH